MADFVIRGATILDGTGTPGFVGDVGVRDGRIAFVGTGDAEGLEVVDGAGLMLATRLRGGGASDESEGRCVAAAAVRALAAVPPSRR